MTASPPPVLLHLSLPSRKHSRRVRSHAAAAPPICSPVTTLLPDAPRASAAARSCIGGGDGSARKITIARRPGRTRWRRWRISLALELVAVLSSARSAGGRGDRQPGSREEASGRRASARRSLFSKLWPRPRRAHSGRALQRSRTHRTGWKEGGGGGQPPAACVTNSHQFKHWEKSCPPDHTHVWTTVEEGGETVHFLGDR